MDPDARPLRLLLVDDSTRFRDAAHRFLATHPRIEIVGAAASAREATDRCRELRPDLVLLDLELPDGTGLDVLREMKPEAPETRFIVVTLHDLPHHRSAAEEAGAHGFVSKNDFSTAIPLLIEEIAGNGNGSPSSTGAALPRVVRETEERYRSLVELSPDVVVVHFEGRVLYVNPAGVALIGASSAAELIGRSLLEFVHPDDRPRVAERMRRAQRGERLEFATARAVRPDGAVVELEGAATPVSFQGCAAVQSVLRDVTARNRERRELADAHARYEQLVANLPIGLYQSEPGGRPLAVNRALRAMFGIGEEDALPDDVLATYVDPSARAEILERLERGEEVVEREVELRRVDDGRKFWARNRARAVRDPTGRLVRLEGFVEDVTAKRALHESLLESERHLAEAQRLAGLGSWVVDFRTGRVDASAEARRLWGIERGTSELYLEHLLDGVVPEDRPRVDESLRRAMTEGGEEDLELRMRLPDGSIRWIHGRGKVEADPETGEPRCAIGTSHDITARRVVEEELRQARDAALEASRLKSVFLANVSHEIRTPLNVILGTSRVFADRLEELGDREYLALMEAATRASKRLTQTIHGILDFSRLESGGFALRPQRLHLRPLVFRQLEEIRSSAERKGIALELDLATDPEIVADEYCVSLALGHLLDNAVKFTPRGRVSVRLSDTGSEASFEVSDTGVGIAAPFLEHLFEPFSQEDDTKTRAFEGAGLGLALSHRLLERNGARLEVESAKGRGSTFRIVFPKPGPADRPPPEG